MNTQLLLYTVAQVPLPIHPFGCHVHRWLESFRRRMSREKVREQHGVHRKVLHLGIPNATREGKDSGLLTRLKRVFCTQELPRSVVVATVVASAKDSIGWHSLVVVANDLSAGALLDVRAEHLHVRAPRGSRRLHLHPRQPCECGASAVCCGSSKLEWASHATNEQEAGVASPMTMQPSWRHHRSGMRNCDSPPHDPRRVANVISHQRIACG
mmetsp:Transcript_39757/g.105028  ORF Transcript_39757/g.105028 Transcript_39757/m.105028 type:complete len:212 (+) Transcript_39757:121-756(+)